MSGIIVGYFGYQRSGKTLLAYTHAEKYRLQGCKVYSNMTVPDWITIKALTDIPFNDEPKVLLLDEAYYFLDSRTWHKLKDSSIFFNTIGKQNILLMLTSINPEMIEVRIRQQFNYVFMAKGDNVKITYRVIDCQRMKAKNFIVYKTPELFKNVRYDTKQVPDYIDTDLKTFRSKVEEYQNKNNLKMGAL